MAAGEIDILETPFWSCAFHQNTPNLCNDEDYKKHFITTGNNNSAGGPFPQS